MRKAAHALARLAYRIAYLALSMLLLIMLVSLGSQLLNPVQRLPGILGYKGLVVISGSMQPAVDPGDLLVIREQGSYLPGDIVTFIEGNSLVTHRLLGISDGYALTRGDANNTDDAPVPLENVLGRMVLRVPGLGSLVLFLRTSQGMLTLTALLVLFIAVPLILRGGSKAKEKEKEEKDKPYEA